MYLSEIVSNWLKFQALIAWERPLSRNEQFYCSSMLGYSNVSNKCGWQNLDANDSYNSFGHQHALIFYVMNKNHKNVIDIRILSSTWSFQNSFRNSLWFFVIFFQLFKIFWFQIFKCFNNHCGLTTISARIFSFHYFSIYHNWTGVI